MSFSVIALILVINIVSRLDINKIVWVMVELIIRLLNRYIIKIPAVTNVDECTRADTGVGAAIAAGSHLEYGS